MSEVVTEDSVIQLGLAMYIHRCGMPIEMAAMAAFSPAGKILVESLRQIENLHEEVK